MSVYKRQIYQIAESNRNFFCPNWNAVLPGGLELVTRQYLRHPSRSFDSFRRDLKTFIVLL